MRIDPKVAPFPMTQEQRYFATALLNMTHRNSLDSFRVRALNPQNAMRELLRMMQPPASSEDLAMVGAEVSRLLACDPILRLPPFAAPASELGVLLDPTGNGKDKTLEKNKHLIQSFTKEIQQKLCAEYVGVCLSWLNKKLAPPVAGAPPSTKDDLNAIKAVTGNLLSVLMDSGASLESLFQYYWQVIAKPSPGKPYVFSDRFSLLVKLINNPAKKFSVVFSVDNLGDPSVFPPSIGGVVFSAVPPTLVSPAPPATRYATSFPNRIFAEIEVETSDERAAGTKAYELLNGILDLVRFEYERNRLHLAEEFLCADKAVPGKYRIFPIPKVVPNPSAVVGVADLQEFALTVGELVGGPGFASDGRDRIQSAFRLYRVGADTNIFENKLTSWWTATEYLVKGGGGVGGIGKAVEDTLVPVLCLGYIKKLLYSFRNTLVDMKASVNDPATGSPVLLKQLDGAALFSLFRNGAAHASLLGSVVVEPFVHSHFEEFLAVLSSEKKILEALKTHEQRLRWHIQRIYRARCDIVHSAERVVAASLLCANLEFYLKSTLTALLQALKVSPHISGPKEFFDRRVHAYGRVLDGLEKGDPSRLLAIL